jgi:hypothetical protein
MSLENWRNNGWLKTHKTSQQEIAALLAVADRDLAACKTPDLVEDWQFNIAYNAALQSATAALAASGYEAERANHHYRVIHSLEFTLMLDPAAIREFDLYRKKRNISDYERADAISPSESAQIKAFASKLRQRVQHWLNENYPELLPAPNLKPRKPRNNR